MEIYRETFIARDAQRGPAFFCVFVAACLCYVISVVLFSSPRAITPESALLFAVN